MWIISHEVMLVLVPCLFSSSENDSENMLDNVFYVDDVRPWE